MTAEKCNRVAHPFKWLVCASVAILAGILLYILSYAPYLRLLYGADTPERAQYLRVLTKEVEPASGYHVTYAPVEWLIDKTDFGDLYSPWAQAWSVRDTMYWHALVRRKPIEN